RQFLSPPIPAAHSRAAYVDFSHHTHRRQLPVTVQDPQLYVTQRLSYHASLFHPTHLVTRADHRPFRRAVQHMDLRFFKHTRDTFQHPRLDSVTSYEHLPHSLAYAIHPHSRFQMTDPLLHQARHHVDYAHPAYQLLQPLHLQDLFPIYDHHSATGHQRIHD